MAERFFSTLKRELVHRFRFATRSQARSAIFEYIEVFYNRQLRHSRIGMVSPAEFERHYAICPHVIVLMCPMNGASSGESLPRRAS